MKRNHRPLRNSFFRKWHLRKLSSEKASVLLEQQLQNDTSDMDTLLMQECVTLLYPEIIGGEAPFEKDVWAQLNERIARDGLPDSTAIPIAPKPTQQLTYNGRTG